LSIQWQVDPLQWRGEKYETDVFLQWLEHYQQRCEKSHWLDRALLPKKLYQYWSSHPEAIPTQVNLRGFDELTPLHQSIIELWQSHGSNIVIEEASQDVQPYQYFSFNDRQSQLTQAALYAKQALDADPKLPIGIIIPAIQDDWANIYDTFTEVLGPEQPFNISAGQPLGQCPIVYAALECLRTESASYLLRTPYISGGLIEQSARALCDQSLSRLLKDPLPIHFVRNHSSLPKQFKLLLNQALDQLDLYHQLSRLPSEWIALIFDLLTLWGWPGDRPPNSEAYQAITHFYELITELSSLDDIVGSCSFARILLLFSQRLNQTMFQAESQDKPVHVLGFLEAAGLEFSHLWVCDMGSDTWPAKPSPNPFIPMAIQLKLGIPHASFARELRFAQTMTERMLTSSQNIVMSYAMHGEEGEGAVLPTPLLSRHCEVLRSNPWTEHAPPLLDCFGVPRNDAKPTLIPMSDPLGLPFRQTHIQGGATVFKDQADCPFRAYAKHRLGAIKPERPQMGLSGSTKGSVIHHILERVWSQLKTREALLNLGKEGLRTLLDQTITRALNAIKPALSTVESDLEKRRLIPLLTEWFNHELNRGPFEILALEKEHTVSIEGLSMTLRIDRVDKIDDQICIIDYKTSLVNTQAWTGPRMDEPQLPLYACVHQPEPNALAFAQILKNAIAWKSSDELEIETWKSAFKELAKEFKEGNAVVLPKKGSATCTHCDLKTFCRVNHDS
jgi:probable DNA repair protein